MRFAMTSTLLLAAAFVHAEPPPLVSVDDLKQMFKDAKYGDVVKETTRQIGLTGPSAASVDKFAVLSLRGESQLRLKQVLPAADSFAKAAKETKEPKDASIARATEVLLKKSPALSYTPKPTKADAKPAPIGVVEDADRKKAFEALWVDEWAAVSPKLEKFKEEKSLPAVMDAVKLVGAAHAIDVAAHGDATDSAAAMTALGDHAREIIGAAMKSMMSRVGEIQTVADKQQTQTGRAPGGGGILVATKRGLYSNDIKELKGIIDTCNKIAPASKELATAMGEDATKFDDVKKQSEEVAGRAKEVLDADYGNSGQATGGNAGGRGYAPGRPAGR